MSQSSSILMPITSGQPNKDENKSTEPTPKKLTTIMELERAHAVDSLELAAFLEADGFSDETLREHYQASGLFDAAEQLYAHPGTGQALGHQQQVAVPVIQWSTIFRAFLYLFPGAAALLAVLPLGETAQLAFTVASAFAWGYSMLLAVVRYAEPHGIPGTALRTALGIAGLFGLISGSFIGSLGINTEHLGLSIVVTTTLSLGLSASAIMLSLGRTRLLVLTFICPLLMGIWMYWHPSVSLSIFTLLLFGLGSSIAAWWTTRPKGLLPIRTKTYLPGLHLAFYGWSVAIAFLSLFFSVGGIALLPIMLGAGLLEVGVWLAQACLKYAASLSQSMMQLWKRSLWILPVIAIFYGELLAIGIWGMQQIPILGNQLSENTMIIVPLFGACLLLSTWLVNQHYQNILIVLWLMAAMLMWWEPISIVATCGLVTTCLLILTFIALDDLRSYR